MLNTQEESAKVAIKTKEARSKNYALLLDVRDLNALADLLMEAISQKIGIKA